MNIWIQEKLIVVYYIVIQRNVMGFLAHEENIAAQINISTMHVVLMTLR